MPYVREGNCVYKKKPDGSKVKKGCSDTVEGAKRYMRKLQMEEHKSLAQFSMTITKASIPDKGERTMRLSMVNSDTGEDVFEERMSLDLFNDFVTRIDSRTPVPEPFDAICEDGWNGGMPYLSISHYKSGNGKNTPGTPERIYVDGEMLKSSAVLSDTPLGRAVWKSVCNDIEERNKPLEEKSFENPVRISIGFLDLEHKHEIEDEEDYIFTRTELKQSCPKCEEGIKGKVYLKGQLVHLAFTRVPANPRTSVEVYKMSDEIETKKQDAESIIGDLADELVGKSEVEKDEALVVKAEESRDEVESTEEPQEVEVMEELKPKEVIEEPVEEQPVEVEAPEQEKSAIDVATDNFKAKLLELKSKGITGDDAVEALQPFFNEMGQVAQNEVNPTKPLTGEDVVEIMKSTIPEIVAQVLKAMPNQEAPKTEEVPVPRSIKVERSANAQPKEMSQIQKLARESIFGAGS